MSLNREEDLFVLTLIKPIPDRVMILNRKCAA